ncbi:Nucleolar complex protein 2-like protein [Smittium culicis]|uniref:Nucleolar complex protein 2-like protein n=1 Tax=Smittium culicis TaxID=133412 RepID=A0A1R1YMI3_9FUNG|nr:Nucleolar complex protein 2-like protein [Smittium culicis]
MAKVKKAQRKFNQKAKKVAATKPGKKEEIVGKKFDKAGSTKKPTTKTKPGTIPKQKNLKATNKDSEKKVRQTRPDRLVEELFTKDENAEVFSDDDLQEFVESKPKFKKDFDPEIDIDNSDSELSDEGVSKNDDIFSMLDVEYQSAEDDTDFEEPAKTDKNAGKNKTTKEPEHPKENAKSDQKQNKKDTQKQDKKQNNADDTGKTSKKSAKKSDKQSTETPSIDDVSDALEKTKAKKSIKKIDTQAKKIQKTIDDLQKKDPEFYEFMKANDPSALDFDMASEDEGSDDDQNINGSDDDINQDQLSDADDNMVSDDDEPSSANSAPTAILLTEKDISNWKSILEQNKSISTLRQAIIAFKAASNSEDKGDQSNSYKYSVRGETEFHKLMMLCMNQVPTALQYHIPFSVPDSDTSGSSKKQSKTTDYKKIIEKSKKWKTLKPFVFTYLDSYLSTIKQISDPVMLSFVLKQSSSFTPYFICFPKLSRSYVRELLKLFGSNSVDDSVVISSLLALRRLASAEKTSSNSNSSQVLVDLALKGVYLTYVRNSNVNNLKTLSRVQLMRNCGVELYEVGNDSIYQHAFIYIRQLAIHLRSSMHTKTKESFRTVYNWQFINSLRFWCELLSTYCGTRADENPNLCDLLEPLIYPLIQIIIGVSRLVPTSKFYPLRIHCMDMLVQISRSTGIFIPVLPNLLGILNSAEFIKYNKKPLSSTLKQFDMELNLKAPKQYEHTRVYLESVLDKVVELMSGSLSSMSTSIGFSDMVVPLLINLKKWKKKYGSRHFSKHSVLISKLIDKINENSDIVLKTRSGISIGGGNKGLNGITDAVNFGPSNFAAASGFMASFDADNMPINKHYNAILKVNSFHRQAAMSALRSQDEQSGDDDNNAEGVEGFSGEEDEIDSEDIYSGSDDDISDDDIEMDE